MRSPLKIGLNLLTIGLIGMGVYNANRAEAVNTQPEGWKLNTNLEAVNTLDTSTSYNGCYVVQNGVNRFVPTRTNGEWNSFKAAPL